MPRYLFPVAIMSTTFLKAVCSLPYISVMCCGEGREEREGRGEKGKGGEKKKGERRRGGQNLATSGGERSVIRTDLVTFTQ